MDTLPARLLEFIPFGALPSFCSMRGVASVVSGTRHLRRKASLSRGQQHSTKAQLLFLAAQVAGGIRSSARTCGSLTWTSFSSNSKPSPTDSFDEPKQESPSIAEGLGHATQTKEERIQRNRIPLSSALETDWLTSEADPVSDR
jgi:hypothetical protein